MKQEETEKQNEKQSNTGKLLIAFILGGILL